MLINGIVRLVQYLFTSIVYFLFQNFDMTAMSTYLSLLCIFICISLVCSVFSHLIFSEQRIDEHEHNRNKSNNTSLSSKQKA